ncbi:MAG: CvpA family protein [Desulfobulbus sp.]|nr:CvpA family protein [Desulfobulbus sp.]
MPTFNDLTYFDLIILFICIVFLLRGIWVGCMRQLGTILALIGGYYLAGQYAGTLLPWAERVVDSPKVTFLMSYSLIFFAAVILFTVIGNVLQRFMRITLLGWLDRFGGLVVGGMKALVVTSLIYMVFASTLSTTNNLLRKSYTSPYLMQGANVLRSWIQDPRLQKYFTQKEPAILSELLSGKQHNNSPQNTKSVQ